MATSKNQRLGIMAILVVTVVGTIGSFAVMVLSSQNQATEDAHRKQLTDEYNSKVTAQQDKLNAKYYPILTKYSDRVAAFDMNTVTSVQTEDLLVGTGQTVDENTQYSAYYIGWNPKGVIFDQSIKEGKLIAPIPAQGLIQGWNEGTKGMKLGGVREITIPSDKAYGEKGGGDKIPPNTPIKFLVLAIETPEQLQPSEELLKLNGYPQ